MGNDHRVEQSAAVVRCRLFAIIAMVLKKEGDGEQMLMVMNRIVLLSWSRGKK